MTEEVDQKRAFRNEIDQNVARAGAVTEEYTRRFEAITVEKQTIEAAVARQKEETGNSAAELSALEGELDNVTEAVNAITAKIEGIKKKLDDTNIPALTDQMEKKKKEIEEAERRLRNKEADMNDASRERQHFTARTGELGEERTRLDERNRQIDTDMAGSNEQIAAHETVIAELEEKQKEFSGELEGLRKKRADVSENIHASELKLMKFDADRERFAIQLTALEERAQVLATEIATLAALVGEIKTDLSLTEIEGKIADAELALHKIGAVNMLAIEEYEKIQRQVDERTERKDTLSKERETLIERIQKYEQMKFEAFMTAFKAIDANFREIFARLTSGSGNLVLENEEDPFTGGLTFAVKPRDKKVHLLSSLSGGEKSLTTLAFIFSIQHYIPAPFYAFDEVDMSLDGANVERIAAMIQELAPSSQFVIVSLRKPMIEAAQRIMGVTSRPDKSTLVTGVKVDMADPDGNGKHRSDKGVKAGRAGEPAPTEAPDREQPGTENTGAAGPADAPDTAQTVVPPAAADAPQEPEPGIVEDPVEILVGLAERGEIDPWNINIIEVTDRFLSELERCRQTQPPDLGAHALFCGDTPPDEIRAAGSRVR